MTIDPISKTRSCNRCADPNIRVLVESKAGLVALCWTCALVWVPGRDSVWLEKRHQLFRDHLSDRMKATYYKEMRRGWDGAS